MEHPDLFQSETLSEGLLGASTSTAVKGSVQRGKDRKEVGCVELPAGRVPLVWRLRLQ